MNVNLTLTDVLLRCTREKYALNLMILLIKQYILTHFTNSKKDNFVRNGCHEQK